MTTTTIDLTDYLKPVQDDLSLFLDDVWAYDALVDQALDGVELGAYDQSVLRFLVTDNYGEPFARATVASLIARARDVERRRVIAELAPADATAVLVQQARDEERALVQAEEAERRDDEAHQRATAVEQQMEQRRAAWAVLTQAMGITG